MPARCQHNSSVVLRDPPWASPRLGAWFFAGALALAGCASGGGEGAATPPADQPLSNAEIEAIYEARLEGARNQYTQADVRFMTAMIHHHAQAVEISQLVPERTSDPTIRTLAARIINAQADEIATMQQWLADRDEPVPHLDGPHVAHMSPATHDMPGMLSDQQLDNLADARGLAFDRLFLTLMIEHHLGAVQMVSELVATDGAVQDEQVFRFASDVQVDQITEIARMERMLAELDPSDDS